MRTDTDLYGRARRAEPRLRHIERMVQTQVLYVRPGDTFCYGCYWDTVLKPLVSPLVGWGRAHPHEDAHDPDPTASSWKPISLAEVLAEPGPPEPSTATERWLRSPEAWDAVTNHFLEILEDADPEHGHGFAKEDAP